MLSVTQPGFAVPAGARFAWLPEATEVHAGSRLDESRIRLMIASSVSRALTGRGYRVVGPSARPDFLVASAAALESGLDDGAILRRFGLLPGGVSVPPDQERFEKGTLILLLIDPRSRSPVWRSAIQALADLNADDGTRQGRIDAAVARMIATLPTDG